MILIGLGLLVFGVVVSVLRSLDEIKKGQRDLGARLDALDARLSEAAERNWRPLAMMVISIAASAACTAPAQEADHFATLVTPPASAGTCVAGRVPAMRDPEGGVLRAHHLVMTTIDPGGRREMTVYTDSAGRPRHYVDWAHRMTSSGESSGESVVATIRRDGRMRGILMRSDRSSGVAPEHPTDTGHQMMRPGATIDRPPAPLTASQHEQVQEVAEWLSRRCPA